MIGSRVIINAASGGGKTFALRRILEETHGRMQHLVLDVEDELYTLREQFDYILIGGEGADAPIAEVTAGHLAISLLELGVSAILQLNDCGGLDAQRRIISAFVAAAWPKPMLREQIAKATGYRPDTGHFGNLLSELCGPEIATRMGRSEIKASDWVMLKSN